LDLTFQEETIEVLNLGHNTLSCWNLDTSESKSEIPGKFWNVLGRMDKISWTDHVRNEEVVLHRVKEERNILNTVKKKEGWLDWSHIA
jgi:hypothetical protein